MNRDEGGTVTLWILGLCLVLFALGGMSLDLWRAFSERRALAAAADAAALTGASAIDEARYRASGEVVLRPIEAETRARASTDRQLDQSAARRIDVHATTDSITVVVHGEVKFTLLGILQRGGFDVRVVATAEPRRSE